jgi:aminoglycoside 3-N-acetyltransferase
MHFDSIGFFPIAVNCNSYLSSLNQLFNDVEKKGGNLLIPSYSYSYTKKELYSIKDTKCTLGRVFDHIRKENYKKRTSDSLFSYLSFREQSPENFFLPIDYESFGDNSLIADVFNNNGYLLSVGNRLHHSTEIHYLERLLNVPYRQNKDFSGVIRTLDCQEHHQKITFYCRDLEFANKHNMTVSFEKLFYDLDRANKIEKVMVNNEVLIEAIHIQEILPFIKKKIKKDIFYLMKPLKHV